MVVDNAESERADVLFHALADPTRRDILAVVLRGVHSVSGLVPPLFDQLRLGAQARRGAGARGTCHQDASWPRAALRGDVATLRSAHELLDDLEALWRGRIDRIEQVLADPTKGAPPCP